MATSIMMATYAIRSKPFHDMNQNYLDIFNEICISLMSYLTLCFTDFVFQATTKYELGWWAVVVFATNLAVNILYILINVISGLVRICYKKCKCCQRMC